LLLAASISMMLMERWRFIASQLSHTLQGSASAGFKQFKALAKIRDGFACAACAAEQVGMGSRTALQLVTQGFYNMGLAHDLVKIAGAFFAV
jgi:hypothetical protein